jgi:hypothetical protein
MQQNESGNFYVIMKTMNVLLINSVNNEMRLHLVQCLYGC